MSTEKNIMQAMLNTSYLSGESADYIESLYEQYLHDPTSVPTEWRNFFVTMPRVSDETPVDISHADIRNQFIYLAQQPARIKKAAAPEHPDHAVGHERKQSAVIKLINAYRSHGHHLAKLDPLNLTHRHEIADLKLDYHGLSEADLETTFTANTFAGLKNKVTLKEIIEALKKTYCSSIGVEYMHISDSKETDWIKTRLESVQSHPVFSAEVKKHILKGLTMAEGLERYLGTKFVGQKRFSLEGGDSLIPMLEEFIQQGGTHHIKETVIGMAHRGRLNVLINVLGKAPEELFLAFADKPRQAYLRSGDVKYHMGFSSDVKTSSGNMHLVLAFNPSHLEIIAPVVEGSVRARQERREDIHHAQVLPLLIHGDAAFAGQGVVMETFNFSQARGYTTGGTVHIVINNQIGFTTSNPLDARSTLYCTDIAKMVQAPVFHVNADDPEAVLFVAQIALAYRMTFKKDVVIDLVCYRRHGHNEADEPSITQPVMYQRIKEHPTPRQIYAEKLIAENMMTSEAADALVEEYRTALDQHKQVAPNIVKDTDTQFAVDWTPYLNTSLDAPAKTGTSLKTIQELGAQLAKLPKDFSLQHQVAKMSEDRIQMTAGKTPLNWGYAEVMAYAVLLKEGYKIRLSGQDCGRGTFNHRHAVLHDAKNGSTYVPLQHVHEAKSFTVIDSILSEEAVLGFEYGYAVADPETLVIWEAQFGDFANGAQVVIDQFISSGEQKWDRLCGLVMLLPHGYEGQGPEHSSARLERYLQLCAQHNIQVCVPSTPAQIFHLLRRQMIRPCRKPLIVMTPKSLLRHKLAISSLADLSKGEFQLIIPEIDDIKPAQVKRVILCGGKVYYDLLEKRREKKKTDIAIVRIEQLYPFPEDELKKLLKSYHKAKEVIWCQEEPQNQGAWYSSQHHMEACLTKDQKLRFVGREASASPAAGYHSLHVKEQSALVEAALK